MRHLSLMRSFDFLPFEKFGWQVSELCGNTNCESLLKIQGNCSFFWYFIEILARSAMRAGEERIQ